MDAALDLALGTRAAQGRRDDRGRERRDRAPADGDLWMGQPETGRGLHPQGQPQAPGRGRHASGRAGTKIGRRCPTRAGGAIQWDTQEQKAVINQRPKKGVVPRG